MKRATLSASAIAFSWAVQVSVVVSLLTLSVCCSHAGLINNCAADAFVVVPHVNQQRRRRRCRTRNSFLLSSTVEDDEKILASTLPSSSSSYSLHNSNSNSTSSHQSISVSRDGGGGDADKEAALAESMDYLLQRRGGEQQQSRGSLSNMVVHFTPPFQPPKLPRKLNIETSIVLMYFCGAVAINAPIVMLPMIASEATSASASATASAATLVAAYTPAAFAVAVTSIATFGSGLGKLVNGFVCQSFGGRMCSSVYLALMSLVFVGFSVLPTSLMSGSPTIVGVTNASVDFLHSILWTCSTVVLSQHYASSSDSDVEKFSKGITALSLSSTAGALTSKLGFSFLLGLGAAGAGGDAITWRIVARLAACFAVVGSLVAFNFIKDDPAVTVLEQTALDVDTITSTSSSQLQPSQPPSPAVSAPAFQWNDVKQSCRRVLLETPNQMFWWFGLAHSMAFVIRTCDKVLGTFFREIAPEISQSMAGGLTSAVTIGFVYGLLSATNTKSKKSAGEEDAVETQNNSASSSSSPPNRRSLFITRYVGTVVSTLVLAACASPVITDSQFLHLGKGPLLAVVAAVASGCLASNISYQFYQLPPLFAKKLFGNNKGDRSVCISLIDGIGFFMSSALWSLVAQLTKGGGGTSTITGINAASTSSYFGGLQQMLQGWPLAWTCLAFCFAAGGTVMMKVAPTFVPELALPVPLPSSSNNSNSKDTKKEDEDNQ
jgi:hypothetical protein